MQAEGVSEAELEKARKQTRAAFAYSAESVTEQAYGLAQSFILGDVHWFDRYSERLMAVSAEDVLRGRQSLPRAAEARGRHSQSDRSGRGGGAGMTDRGASIPNSSNIARAELENGITLLVYENPAVQSVNLMGSFHAGSIYETPEKSGLASLAAGALMTGTTARDFDAIHGALEDIGADLGFRGHIHKAGLSGKALAEDLSLLLEVAAEALRQPVFPAEHVERLRGERLTWLQYSSFDTRYRAAKRCARRCIRRRILITTAHTATKIPSPGSASKTYRSFHAAHFGPRGMILVIVGAIAAADAIKLATDAFGDWRNPAQPAVRQAAEPEACSDRSTPDGIRARQDAV